MKITKQRIVARLILEKDGHILLLKRPKWKGGNYSLIGGHVEKNESIMEAIKRETYEEAGIRVKRKNLELVHIAHRNKQNQYVLYVFFRTQKWKGILANQEPHKCEGLEWFDLDNLPNADISPTTFMALECLQMGLYYSDDWNMENRITIN